MTAWPRSGSSASSRPCSSPSPSRRRVWARATSTASRPLLIAHATNAFAVLVLAVIGAVLGVAPAQAGRPGWTLFLPVGIIVAIAVQMMLGFAEVKGTHVFLGVLILCTITACCSYSWRFRLPEGGATTTAAPTSA